MKPRSKWRPNPPMHPTPLRGLKIRAILKAVSARSLSRSMDAARVMGIPLGATHHCPQLLKAAREDILRYDLVALNQIRTETQASLRSCLDALAQVNGDVAEAIARIQEHQACLHAAQTDAAIDRCLHVIQMTHGDLEQAQRQLRLLEPSTTVPADEASSLIYISVSGYPELVWRPITAVHVHGQCYQILSENPDPEHEYWQFNSSEIVQCSRHQFAEHEFGLVATARCED